MPVDWNVQISNSDLNTVKKIARRCTRIFSGAALDETDYMMYLYAAYTIHKIDIDRLDKFDDFNFTHDIAGICHHLNRETGEMEGGFLPRCGTL